MGEPPVSLAKQIALMCLARRDPEGIPWTRPSPSDSQSQQHAASTRGGHRAPSPALTRGLRGPAQLARVAGSNVVSNALRIV